MATVILPEALLSVSKLQHQFYSNCIRSYLKKFEVEEATTISLIDDEFCCIQNNFTGSANLFLAKRLVATIDCVEVAAFFANCIFSQVYPKSAKKVTELSVIVIRCICDIFLILLRSSSSLTIWQIDVVTLDMLLRKKGHFKFEDPVLVREEK